MFSTEDPVNLILGNCNQQTPTQKFARLDVKSKVYVTIIFILIVLALPLGICYLANGEPRVGVPLLIAVAAFITYGFNTTLQRQVRVGENTSGVLAMLRGRWDELRTDQTLSAIISGEKTSISNQERIKFRLFLYTLFDTYEYAIHLIYNGYFDFPDSLAVQYRNLIAKTLCYPYVVEIWEEKDRHGGAIFQNEYTNHLRGVVNAIIIELRANGDLPRG